MSSPDEELVIPLVPIDTIAKPAYYPPEEEPNWVIADVKCVGCGFIYKHKYEQKGSRKHKVELKHFDGNYHEIMVSNHRVAAVDQMGFATRFRDAGSEDNA